MKNILSKKIILLLALLLIPTIVSAQLPEERSVELRTDPKKAEENIVEVIIGTTPPLPTENGLLILRAFDDRNGDGKHDSNEDELENLLTCRIDDVEYALPAFIPGLKYNGNYQLTCTGETFTPSQPIADIFISQRGQIIKLDLACRNTPPPAAEAPPVNR